jgi:hypothetical protein
VLHNFQNNSAVDKLAHFNLTKPKKPSSFENKEFWQVSAKNRILDLVRLQRVDEYSFSYNQALPGPSLSICFIEQKIDPPKLIFSLVGVNLPGQS